MKYRPHRRSLNEAMAAVVEVNNIDELIAAMMRGVENWYPANKRPTLTNIIIEPYSYDKRINWNTHSVTVNGQIWGFTDGPFMVNRTV